MTGEKMEILAVIRDSGFYQQIETFMARSGLQVTRVSTGSQSLPLATKHLYDLIVAQNPLPDLTLRDFFAGLRGAGSASAGSPTLVLTRDDQLDQLDPYLDGHLVQACCVEAPEQNLHQAMAELLGVAPRVASRLFLRLGVRLGGSDRLFETINLSETGVLVHAREPLAVGKETDFLLESPWEEEPITGTAHVVRHTEASRESACGFAMRFVALEPAARAALALLIERQAAQPAH